MDAGLPGAATRSEQPVRRSDRFGAAPSRNALAASRPVLNMSWSERSTAGGFGNLSAIRLILVFMMIARPPNEAGQSFLISCSVDLTS